MTFPKGNQPSTAPPPASNAEFSKADAQPKAKKGCFVDKDYHGFCRINGQLARFTTYRGVRYVQAQDIVDEKFLTTIGGRK